MSHNSSCCSFVVTGLWLVEAGSVGDSQAEQVTCEGDSSREAEDSLLSLLWLRGGGQGLTMLPLEGQGVLLQLAQRNGGGARGKRSAC